jgi:hypothetical protein
MHDLNMPRMVEDVISHMSLDASRSDPLCKAGDERGFQCGGGKEGENDARRIFIVGFEGKARV